MRQLLDSHVSKAGLAQTAKQSVRAPVKTIFFDQMSMLKYESTMDIVNQHFEYQESEYHVKEDGELATWAESIDDGTVIVTYDMLNLLTMYKRYPDTLVMGLSKIGGLFFFVSLITLVLYTVHY